MNYSAWGLILLHTLQIEQLLQSVVSRRLWVLFNYLAYTGIMGFNTALVLCSGMDYDTNMVCLGRHCKMVTNTSNQTIG